MGERLRDPIARRHRARDTPAVSIPKVDLQKLTPGERLDLLTEIWDSFSSAPKSLPLTEPQRQELDDRIDDLERDSSPGIPWEDVLARIRKPSR